MNAHDTAAHLAVALEDTRFLHTRLVRVAEATVCLAQLSHLQVSIKQAEDMIVSLSVAVQLARNQARQSEFRKQRPALLDQLSKSLDARRCEATGSNGSNVVPFGGPEGAA